MDKKILLVEDDLFIRDLYQHVLKQDGFTVVSAQDGEEALRLAQDVPDLMLLDIMLPKMNGIDVLKKLKSDDKTKNIPVFMLTNLGDDTIIKQTTQIGAVGYLLKSNLSPYEIVNAVKEFLKNKQ